MNKNKISPEILNSVSVLNNSNCRSIVVAANDFNSTKNFLLNCKYNFKPYRFANCFCLDADFEDINILSNQDFVNYIYANSKVKISGQEKDLINISALTQNKYLGQGQTICFIDTGITPHFDFLFPKNRIIKFLDFTDKNMLFGKTKEINNSFCLNKINAPYDDNGHGTFVAGIACGNGIFDKNIQGYAPMANIVAIKALGEKGNSNSNTILDAMQWVFENHKAFNISVVCMSFGADVINESDPLSRGAESLWKRGITVVAAAGNSGPEKNTIKSPGNNPYIITVGGLDSSSMNVAEFSSRGPTIFGSKPDLLAPAVDIVACNNLGKPYTNMSGTSVATPIVAGICADIKSRWPKITNNEIKKFLLAHCVKLTGDTNQEGAGYLKF